MNTIDTIFKEAAKLESTLTLCGNEIDIKTTCGRVNPDLIELVKTYKSALVSCLKEESALSLVPPQEIATKATCYSKLLDDKFTINDDYSMTFESGVTYTEDEVKVLSTLSSTARRDMHKLKKTFGGTVQSPSDEITEAELKESAGEDWEGMKDNPELLEAFKSAVQDQKIKERGGVPLDYTATTHCKNCGDVFVPPALASGGNVLGCPWCWNKANSLPIPKPIV